MILSLSQECVKPVMIENKERVAKIQIKIDGIYYQLNTAGNKIKLEKAKITHNCVLCDYMSKGTAALGIRKP